MAVRHSFQPATFAAAYDSALVAPGWSIRSTLGVFAVAGLPKDSLCTAVDGIICTTEADVLMAAALHVRLLTLGEKYLWPLDIPTGLRGLGSFIQVCQKRANCALVRMGDKIFVKVTTDVADGEELFLDKWQLDRND